MRNRLRLLATVLLLLLSLGLWWAGYLHRPPEAIIRWTTESEVETVGFHVYRATQEPGPYERVTERLISSAGDPFAGGAYEFRDLTVQAGQTYFYQLEELESSGTFTRLPDTVSFEARREPNWPLIFLLVAPLFLLWLLPSSSRVNTI